jgi:hypothetical protein
LDKERQSRKHTMTQFSNLEESTKAMRKNLSEWETKIAEMQKSRSNEQKTFRQAESQYKDQVAERNSLLSAIWVRLGEIVGSKWVDRVNSQAGGDITPENNFAAFSRNVSQCVKVLEDVMVNFKLKCKAVERSLWNDYKYLSISAVLS